MRCQDCKFSRTYGEAPLTADTKATGHAVRMGHVVHRWHDTKPEAVTVVGNKRETLDEIPPF